MTTKENSIQTEINTALRTALLSLLFMCLMAFTIGHLTKDSALFKGILTGSLCGYSAFCLLIAGTKKSIISLKGKLISVIFMVLRLGLFAAFFITAAKKTSINFPAAVISCFLTYQSFLIKTGIDTVLKKNR